LPARAAVTTARVPHQGIQPQVAVDERGVVHLIYFSGEAAGGDVHYVKSMDAGRTFSPPLRVNSVAGSVIAVGNIRGAHLALGKNGRVHVAWMGSKAARTPSGEAPMLYARLNDQGTAFEAQRNVIQFAYGLDGGGSVAADDKGNVYVAWHAAKPGSKGEENHCIWLTRSRDEGKSFAPEEAPSADATGACGCCGMRALSDRSGKLYMLYRSARERVNRDSYLLTAGNDEFRSVNLHPWKIGLCPMSSYCLADTSGSVIAAWDTDGQVYFAAIDPKTGEPAAPRAAPGAGGNRKHPVIARNTRGETILVWTEGMGWNRGGALAWQVFDRDGRPTAEHGRTDGVPRWSLVAVFTSADDSFTILY
jgi:hypothetical protein